MSTPSIESPFFKLPGELRNEIYDYLLNHDGVLHPAAVFATEHASKTMYEGDNIVSVYQRGEMRPAVTRCRARTFRALNQLQYVNKQLRAETAGLAFQFNKYQLGIHASWKHEDGPALQLYAWMISVGVKQLKRLGKISITLWDSRPQLRHGDHWMSSDTAATMSSLYSFLGVCSNITVNYVQRQLNPALEGLPWFRLDLWLSQGPGRAIRKAYLPMLPHDSIDEPPSSLQGWRELFGKVDKPANMTILPDWTGGQRTQVLTALYNHGPAVNLTEDDVWGWVARSF